MKRFTPVLLWMAMFGSSAPAAEPDDGLAELPATVARAAPSPNTVAYDGVIEALRQTVVAAQVSGAVVDLKIKVGDRVNQGDLLMRLDARAADQNAAASAAQLRAARAAQEVAAMELARQQKLAAERFISPAALDRAQGEYKAASAQVAALLAQTGAATTQSGFFVVRAPYSGVVADLPVMLGDMAMPGRALVTLFDPSALRISAAVPQSAAGLIGDGRDVRAEIPTLASPEQRTLNPRTVQILPAADSATHTVTVRADLPLDLQGALPGQFARLWLPAAQLRASPWVPAGAIVRRAEMVGLYVLDSAGRPLLRQVRLGRSNATHVEVLTGLSEGERVADNAQTAARLTAWVRPRP